MAVHFYRWRLVQQLLGVLMIIFATVFITLNIAVENCVPQWKKSDLPDIILINRPPAQPLKENKSNPIRQHPPANKTMENTQWNMLKVEESKLQEAQEIFPPNASIPMTVTSPYIIPNKKHCSNFLKVKYLVLVHTAPGNIGRRQGMRKTWTNQNNYKDVISRTVFLMGKTLNPKIQKGIFAESKKFGDIVQGSFIDAYANLTLKAVMGLRWVAESCPHAEFIIKVDDDVFVNIPKVKMDVFPTLANNSRDIVCLVEKDGPIFRLGAVGEEDVKWIASCDFFKYSHLYPMPFCYGFVTIYSVSLAVELFDVAKSTPFYPFDDVFVYGILPSKLKGVTWRNATTGFYKTQQQTLKAFNAKKMIIAGTANSAGVMQKLWKKMH